MEEYLLLRAGVDLLSRSGLLKWDQVSGSFGSLENSPSAEQFAKNGRFGRLISWILFSVGAEYVLKAVCEAKGIISPTTRPLKVEYPPSGDVMDWAHMVTIRSPEKTVEGAIVVRDYGTLGAYVNEHIRVLAEKLSLNAADRELLIAGFKLLTAIRNRDVHAYEKDVREAHFFVVEQVFVPCLNVLLNLLPEEVTSAVSVTS